MSSPFARIPFRNRPLTSDEKSEFFDRTVYSIKTLEPLSMVEKVDVLNMYEEARRARMKYLNTINKKMKSEEPEQFKLWRFFCKLEKNKGLSMKEKSQKYREMSSVDKLQLEYEMDNDKYNNKE